MKLLVVIGAAALAAIALTPASADTSARGGITMHDDWNAPKFMINPDDPNGDTDCTSHGWTVSKDAQGNKICVNPSAATQPQPAKPH